MKQFILKKEYLVILVAILIKLAFQLIATAHSGYHGDELLHIESGKHLAPGYMDFPPFIAFLAWFQNLFHSDSLYIHHLFNYLNSAIIVLICGLITLRLGGGTLALLLTESAIIFSPGLAASQYLFLPTAFEQLFWVLFIFCLVAFCAKPDPKLLLIMALIAATGLLNKYSIVFLFAGFILSTQIFKRELLQGKTVWLALMVFVTLILPNIIWQVTNNFPIFHHMSELYKTQLDKQSLTKELTTIVFSLNPLSLIFWVSALLIIPFSGLFKSFRLPVFTLLFSCLLLMLSKGKSYYFFPIVLSLIPFGTVYFEQLIRNRLWIGYSYIFLLVGSGMYLLPHGIPLLKIETYIALYRMHPDSDQKIPLTFENYYSKQNWDRILKSVSRAYHQLSDEEQKHCYIWGRHYSMAGGINLLGKKYKLPEAFSFHSSFYAWVPDFDKRINVIAISESNLKKSYWEQFFDMVEEFDTIDNHYAFVKNWYNYRIFVCHGIKYNSAELKQIFRSQIF